MIVYGKQVFLYIIQKHLEKLQRLLLCKNIEQSLYYKLKNRGILIEHVDSKKAQALAKGGNHQGFLMEITMPQELLLKDMMSFSSLLILEGISDTHNIGALFRSAYCLGFAGIILTQISSFSYAGAIKTSSGALLDVPFCIYQDSLSLSHELKMAHFMLYGAMSGGIELSSCFLENKNLSKIALFLGSEGEGLRKKLIKKMDYCVSVPLENDFNSLNVGVAAAILMDRIRNGRRKQTRNTR